VADKLARAIQRNLMPELVAGLRREVAKLPGASVISEDGRVIKSPWVDPKNGQILPYNLEEDAKLVQSLSGDLWTLVEAMVETTSAAKTKRRRRQNAQADAGDEDKTAALVDALEERDEAEETLVEYVETEDAVFPLDIGDGEHEEYDGDRRSIPAAVAMPASALTAEALAGAIDGDIGGSDDEMGTTVQCDWYVSKYICYFHILLLYICYILLHI
jgi:hypothetical protein